MITGTVTKASQDSKVGIVFERKPGQNCVIISKIVEGGLFSKTDLIAGLEVAAVNGKDVAGMTTKAIADLLRSAAPGELSVTAKSPVVGKAMKPSKSSRIGITLTLDDMGAIIIKKIEEDSLLANTDLKVGLEVIAVNGKDITGMQPSDVTGVLRAADAGEISITATGAKEKKFEKPASASPEAAPVVEKVAPEPPPETAPEPPQETAPEPPQAESGPEVITPTKIKSLIVGDLVESEPNRTTVVGTTNKVSKEEKVGIRFASKSTGGPVVIHSITKGGAFDGSELKAGYEVVSINGTSMAGKSHTDAVSMIKETVGEVTVTTSAPANLVTATVVKETQNTRMGIGIERLGSTFTVQTITEGGLFAKTDLKVGNEIISMNGVYPGGMTVKEAVSMLRSAGPGEVTIVALA